MPPTERAIPLRGTGDAHHGYYWVGQHFLNPRVEDAAALRGVCKRNLTYMLDSPDSGLGRILLGLWSAYGLAVSENRTFFVDDSNWLVFTLVVSFLFSAWLIKNGWVGPGELMLPTSFRENPPTALRLLTLSSPSRTESHTYSWHTQPQAQHSATPSRTSSKMRGK